MSKALDKVLDIMGVWNTEHDPWGEYLGAWFDVAEVLDMADVVGNVTPEVFERWGYGPSPYVSVPDLESVADRADTYAEGEWADDYGWGTVALARAVVDGEVSIPELIYVGDVLSRVTDRLREQGRDY